MRRSFIAIVTLAVLLTGSGASAQRTPRTPLPHRTPGTTYTAVQQHCARAIDFRFSRIDGLKSAVTASVHITSDHRSKLNGQLDAAKSGLTALRAKIAADSNGTDLRYDCVKIREDYRIYVLVSPKTREVIVGDAEAAIAGQLTSIAAKIQTKIDEAKARNIDVTTAQGAVDAMKAHAHQAAEAASGVAGAVIDLVPSDWPGAHDTLVKNRQLLRTAREDLRLARQEGRTAVADIRHHG